MSENERNLTPWKINSWEELEKALEEMTPDNRLFKTVKQILKKRGNWKNAPRGESKNTLQK